jgi:hypothetical protein
MTMIQAQNTSNAKSDTPRTKEDLLMAGLEYGERVAGVAVAVLPDADQKEQRQLALVARGATLSPPPI